ncbi:hypothetical protein [uncultured Pontibacter sp.]|uniref:hypothetical protein n=1 Tax=uncultured Pontibacter sp. TaxID=453356 RepID=UPI00261886AB|nr:hypothetical protein [uncultured Pontibacter sp.]
MSKANNNNKKKADAANADAVEKIMSYLDGSFINDYGKGHARRLAAKQRELEAPFRKEVDESLAADLGIAYTGPGATSLVITTPGVAHRYLQAVHAQVAFEALKLAFHGMYAGGVNELLLKNEVERIQGFIAYSEEQDTHDAMDAPPSKGVANVDSNVDYRIADTSYAAEYLRLKNDFYETHFYEGSPFDRPSMVYALCWLFLPYLQGLLSHYMVQEQGNPQIDARTVANKGKESNTVAQHKSLGLTQAVRALYYYYLQEAGYEKPFECHERGKLAAIEEIALESGFSPKAFQAAYNKIQNSRSTRVAGSQVKNLQAVTKLLVSYPKALELVQNELKQAEMKR